MTRTIYLLSLNTTVSTPPLPLFSSAPGAAAELLWLSPSTLAYLNDSSLYTLPINYTTQSSRKRLFDFPAGINAGGLQYEASSGILAFTAQVWEDGSFDAVKAADEAHQGRRDTGMVYDELFFRHWDTWRTPGKVHTIGMTKLVHDQDAYAVLSDGAPFKNVLNGTGLYNQMDALEFALSEKHLAISAKALHLNPATHTRQDVYLLDHSGSPTHITPGAHGAISGLTFSPDGRKLAWLEMAEDGYESDKRVVVVHHVKSRKNERWTDSWDRSPSSIEWSVDSKSIYVLAEYHGRVLPYHLSQADHLPTPLLFNQSTTALTPLAEDKLLLSISNLTNPLDSFVLTLPPPGDDKLPRPPLHALTNWSHLGLDLRIEELWWTGADGLDVMAWVLKPHGWDASKKYPLAYFIHGGPQGAWEDAWSTRWNPALFAMQGYFVVAPNPTGSTGYGQEFTDRIKAEWGGRPFKDLVAGYRAALDTYPEIDPDRTTALGGSYGGYMVNWIQGHNDMFGFKAMVCHDGIFDTLSAYYTTEELWFPAHDLAGTPLTDRLTYEKWNPMNHVGEWSTPQLTIHSGQDFRLVDGQGFAAFTALQLAGVPSRLLYFPDENHWVLKPHNSIKWHHEVFKWLDEWVGEEDKKVAQGEEGSSFVIQHLERI